MKRRLEIMQSQISSPSGHQFTPPVSDNALASGSAQASHPLPSLEQHEPTHPLPEHAVRLGRVLHIINGEHFSGAERVQQLLGKRLPELGYEAEFACVKTGRFKEHCGLAPERVSEFPMHSRLDFKVAGRLAKKVVEGDIDLLHAHTPRTALLTSLVAFKTGRPWVYHVHSPTARDSTRGIVNRINAWVEGYSIRSCDKLLTVSKSLRREMLGRGVARKRLAVVPNGVPNIEPIDASARYSLREWRLGMVALMRPRKGVEVALAAMKDVVGRGMPVTLDLIGGFETDEYRDQILRLIESYQLQNSVTWLGFTNDVPTAIRRLDALLLPSLFGEGMPMVVLEALAAGVPVVATRVEGTPEVIRDGVEGLLAEPGNAEHLAQKIVDLTACRKEWAQMSHRGLARHRESFSDLCMAERVARAYTSILHSGQ